MVAYQFYCMGEGGKDDLIAILPERRRNPDRVTDRSILNWATEVIGNGCNGQSIYFVDVELHGLKPVAPPHASQDGTLRSIPYYALSELRRVPSPHSSTV
jgi:hypothetical protein